MAVLYLVEKRLPAQSGIDADSFLMFHGFGRRFGASYPLLEYSLGDTLSHPLSIKRNFWRKGDVFQPNLSWIVTREVRNALGVFPNVDFLPVKFDRVFSVSYQTGDNKFGHNGDDEDFLDQFTDDHDLRVSIGDLFEVVVAMYDRVRPSASKVTQEVFIEREAHSKPVELRISSPFLREYPIFKKRGHCLTAEVYQAVRGFLNPEFFSVSKTETEG